MADWLVPLITFVLGAVAAFARDYIGVRQESRRERDAREAERAAAVRERREEFELKHLVEVGELLRAEDHALRVYMLRIARANDESEAYSGEAGDQLRTATGAVRSQVGYLLADEVREVVMKAHKMIWEVFEEWQMYFYDDDPIDFLGALDEAMAHAHELISARVREIYAGRE